MIFSVLIVISHRNMQQVILILCLGTDLIWLYTDLQYTYCVIHMQPIGVALQILSVVCSHTNWIPVFIVNKSTPPPSYWSWVLSDVQWRRMHRPWWAVHITNQPTRLLICIASARN